MLFRGQLKLEESLEILGIYLIGVIGIAVTGHVINDYYDRVIDKKAGKSNSLTNIRREYVITILVLLQIVALLPWFFLGAGTLIWLLISLQYLLYILYSHPLTRWKGKGVLGVFADALYGHSIPVLVTFLAISPNAGINILDNKILIISIFLWQILKGGRNILLHQIEDRKIDGASPINTFVVKHGGLYSLNIINRIVLPLEILLLLLITAFFSIQLQSYYLSIIIFALWTFVKFSGWKLFTIPYRQLKFKFLFFLNDFYEDWMPLIFLIFLIQRYINFIILLGLHFLLFRKTILNLIADTVIILKNVFQKEERAI